MSLWQWLLGAWTTPPDDWRKRAALADQETRIAALAAAGQWKQALPLAQALVAASRRVLGLEDDRVVLHIELLAGIYEHLGGWTAAEIQRRDAVMLRRTYRGPQHPALAHSLRHLAAVYLMMGRPKQATPLLQEAAAIEFAVYGEERPLAPGGRVRLPADPAPTPMPVLHLDEGWITIYPTRR
jgi:hypothetical protein